MTKLLTFTAPDIVAVVAITTADDLGADTILDRLCAGVTAWLTTDPVGQLVDQEGAFTVGDVACLDQYAFGALQGFLAGHGIDRIEFLVVDDQPLSYDADLLAG